VEHAVTQNAKPTLALADSSLLSHQSQQAYDSIHLMLLNEVAKGLADVAAGRSVDARQGLKALLNTQKHSKLLLTHMPI
jgi:predicted transcriptional regulator